MARWKLVILGSQAGRARTLSISRGALAVVATVVPLLVTGLAVWLGWVAHESWSPRALLSEPAPVEHTPTISREPAAGDERVESSAAPASAATGQDLEAAAAEVVGEPTEPLVPDGVADERILRLALSDETLDLVPFESTDGNGEGGGESRAVAMLALGKRLGCDGDSGERGGVDPALVRVLLSMSHHFGGARVEIVSSARPPRVEESRIAKLHRACRAVDVRLEGVALGRAKRAAWGLGGRGIGAYPEEDYLHLDVGDKRLLWEHGEAEAGAGAGGGGGGGAGAGAETGAARGAAGGASGAEDD